MEWTVGNEAVDKLARLPWGYADMCGEMYVDSPDYPTPDLAEIEDCVKRWTAHLTALAAEPAPELEEEPSDEMAELRRAALNHRGEP